MIAPSNDLLVFLGLVVSGAAFALSHVAATVRAVRARQLPLWLRALAWLPPFTWIALRRSGARLRAWLWGLFAGAYLVLRALS